MPIIRYVRSKDEYVPMEVWDISYCWKVIEVGATNEDGTQPAQIDLTIYTVGDDGKNIDLVEVAIWEFEKAYIRDKATATRMDKVILEEMIKLMSAEDKIRYEDRKKNLISYFERIYPGWKWTGS